MKAAIYCRKSTEGEDRQVLSLEQQMDANTKKLKENGDDLFDTYPEEKSAKRPGRRKEFRRLMDDIKEGKVEVIYCWKLNRLARNFEEAGEVGQCLTDGLLKAIVTNERTYLPEDNVIQMYVELGMADQYSRDLGKDVARGMQKKIEMGWKPGPVPVGYMPDYDGQKGYRVVHKDPERFDIMRRCWRLLLDERKSVTEIHKIATEKWGLTKRGRRGKPPRAVGLSSMYQLFKNEFYTGHIIWKGEAYEGKHEAMVTFEEFMEAERIISGLSSPRPRVYPNPYAGIIQCGECGAQIIMELKRKFVVSEDDYREYRYYRCSKRKRGVKCTQKCRLTHDQIEPEIAKVAYKADIPESLVQWSLKKLRLSQDDIKEQQEKELGKLQERHKAINKKRSELVDRQLDEATRIPEDLYQEKLKEFSKQAEDLQQYIRDFEANAAQWSLDVIDAITFTENLHARFDNGGMDERLEILMRLGQRIELKDGVLTAKLKEPYEALVRGKEKLENKYSRFEPLSVALEKAKEATRDQIFLEWWVVLDSNQ